MENRDISNLVLVMDRAIERRYEVYDQVRQNDTVMREMLPLDPPGRTVRAFLSIPSVLADYPDMLNMFEGHLPADDASVAMMLYPQVPLVLARYRGSKVAIVPTMSCTREAVLDLLHDKKHDPLLPLLFSSTPELSKQEVCASARAYSGVPLKYDYPKINPADHIALAAQGFLRGEIFRISLDQITP